MVLPDRHIDGALTTPDPVALHKQLAELADAGIDHLAMEASSHGLDQFRLDGVRVQAAAFTNLSRDHLDYHGTLDAYFAAKRRLFTDILRDGGLAVLNADAPEFAPLAELCRAPQTENRFLWRRRPAISASSAPTPAPTDRT